MTQNLREKFEETALENLDKIVIKYRKTCELSGLLEGSPTQSYNSVVRKDGSWINISYDDFRNNVESLSAFLAGENIKKGDKVAILLGNRPEWPMIFFASVSVGAVVVPLNPESTEKEIESILRNSECKIVFAGDKALFEKVSLPKCVSLENVISVDSDEFRYAMEFSEEKSTPEIKVSPSDLACLLYTSGTTDEPKGVMLSHKNLLSNSKSLRQTNLVTQEDSVLAILPLHHVYSLTVTMLLPLLYGGTIVYPGTMRSEVVLEAMRETNPTVFIAVPQIFYIFHKTIKERLEKIPFLFRIFVNFMIDVFYKLRNKTGVNLARFLFRGIHRRFGSHLRLFVSGGAKLDEDVEEMLFKLGFTILEGFGLTETAPVLTINPLEKPKIGSVGLPVSGVELRIEGRDAPGAGPVPERYNAGEVVVRGANIMEGYYRRKDLTREVIKDGWFHTGDLGYLDEDGYLFLTGRIKEVIVLSSGKNIYPAEIEEAYSREAPVNEMCVFEVPAKKGLEESLVLWAVVVPDLGFFRKYGEINLKNVIKERFDNVSRTLPPYKRIMGFFVTLEELPHTLLGKIKRFAVKEIYTPRIVEEERVSEPEELSEEELKIMKSEPGWKITNYLKKRTGAKEAINPRSLLELDLGIDSLGRIELVSGLEEIFNMRIKEEVVGRAFTVKDLIMGIGSLLKEGGEALPVDERVTASGPSYWKEIFQVLPRKENLDKIDLKPGFAAWLGGFLFILPFYLIFKMFYSFKVEGRENFPKESPYILYVNHTSYLDAFLVASALPRFPRLDLFFVGFRPYFNVPVIRGLVKIGRIIPLDFASHLLEALRSCYYVLKNGRSLCLFPEGLRTLDGNIAEFKKGFGILVKETGVKLVPVILDGSFEAWPRTAKFPKRHPIKVKFGGVLDPDDAEKEGYRLGAKDSYEAICVAARNALIKLKG